MLIGNCIRQFSQFHIQNFLIRYSMMNIIIQIISLSKELFIFFLN
nr:MAG TPA: hypothetical protein [Caudoviricetes sp.]